MGGSIELRMDVRTGFVFVPNTKPGVAENGQRGAILYAKRNDTLQLALALDKDGENQSLMLGDLKIALKAAEPEETVVTSSGIFWETGQYEAKHYIFELPLPAAALDTLLAEEEDDDGTYRDFIAEIQYIHQWFPPGTDPEDDPAPTPRELPRTSQEFLIRIARDWIGEE